MKNTNEKPLKYCLTIDTPSGKCQIATESWQILVELLDPFASTDTQQNINSLAKRAQIAYYKSYKTHRNKGGLSRISRNDMEIEVILCYIRGWTGKETIDWLRKHRKYITSSSAIGRYWRRLRAIGVIPVHRLDKDGNGKDEV